MHRAGTAPPAALGLPSVGVRHARDHEVSSSEPESSDLGLEDSDFEGFTPDPECASGFNLAVIHKHAALERTRPAPPPGFHSVPPPPGFSPLGLAPVVPDTGVRLDVSNFVSLDS